MGEKKIEEGGCRFWSKTVNELTGAVGNIQADAIENVPVASIDKKYYKVELLVYRQNTSGQL